MGSQNEEVPNVPYKIAGGSFGEFKNDLFWGNFNPKVRKQSQGTWTVDDLFICPDEAAGHTAALHATLWLWRLWREL